MDPSELTACAARVLRGEATQEDYAALAGGGPEAVRAVLETQEPLPPSRDFRDASADLDGALSEIARTDPEAVIAALAEHPTKTATLARALGAGGDAAVEPLVALLDDRDRHVRAVAAQALGRIGTPRALAPMPALLSDRSGDVRGRALDAIAEHLTPEAEESLRTYLGRKDLLPGLFLRAAETLAALEWRRLGPPPPRRRAVRGKVAEQVRKLVEGTLPPTAFTAAGVPAVRALVDGQRLPIPTTRRRADVAEVLHFALQVIAGRDPDALLAVLDERPEAAAQLARALEFATGEGIEDALISLVDHPNPLARIRAVNALERSRTPRAIEAIRRLHDDPSLAVRLVATRRG